MTDARALGIAIVLALGLAAAPVWGEPLARKDVPEPLRPWVDWVLRGAEDGVCPFVHGNRERRQCVWPARLELTLAARGGGFVQTWNVYRSVWVPLPGDAAIWPEDVTVDAGPVPVVAKEGAPGIRLAPGAHSVRGRFSFHALPESLAIPVETGLVQLRLAGERVAFPDRDREGRLWLRRPPEAQEGGSRLDVSVHRRVTDDVPLLLDTRIELRVAGAAREVLLGPGVPGDFVAMSLFSPLPTRVEGDGRLRVQVRPGTWQIRLLARHTGGPAESLALGSFDAKVTPWDPEEIWVFEARPELRVVEVEGVPGIDPQQTQLPPEWRGFPTYLMQAGSTMKLVEQRRGGESPAADQLALQRTLWLDFDGGGYTISDTLQGTLTRSWRLEVAAPMELGRVAIDGQDQFLSKLGADDRDGVEVRQGQLQLEADARMEGVRGRIPALGWAHDVQKVSGQLNLPPGWRLVHAGGVDDVRTTWIGGWSLLEIFLVIVTAMIVAQLHGLAWGGVAFAALVLIYPEDGAPRFIWLAPLAATALLRVLPEGRPQDVARLGRLVAIAGLALIAIPFAVGQARLALYPALELPQQAVVGEAAKRVGFVQGTVAQDALSSLEESPAREGKLVRALPASAPVLRNYYAPDPTALVSTGPGLPHWAWRTIHFSWRGPVRPDQEVWLLLAPPWLGFVLAWLRIALLAGLAACVMDVLRFGALLRGGSTALLALALGAGLAGAPGAAQAELPPKELLDELRARLLEPPECFPACAASPRLSIEVKANVLRMRVGIDAAADTAVPLPGALKQWEPEQVLLDGAPARGLARSPDGSLWIPLTAGRHQVVVSGALPERDSVQIALPLRPHRVTLGAIAGWQLDGVRDGEVGAGVQLTRERDSQDGALDTLEAQDLPPFVRVERTLRLGLAWQVDTRVLRVSPTGRALFLEIPLLAGESPTTDAIDVDGGVARVSLGASAKSVAWSSVLEYGAELSLEAVDALAWTELWTLDASPIWHVETAGIPTVHVSETPSIRTRSWRPWPGERVDLRITRPSSLDGRTLTIDRTELQVSPGLRSSEAELHLSIRASRGLQHSVVLPESSELLRVDIDGASQPLRADAGRVVLPIRPGAHTATLVWRSDVPISPRYVTPAVDVGAPSVNAEIELAVPHDRWVLLVGGPRLGPAVLFWSLAIVALLVAFGLGRVPLTPLGMGSWFLLFAGLSQLPIFAAGVVVVWLLALGWRGANGARAGSPAAFDGLQVLVAFLTLSALVVLVVGVWQGLLGAPDMQIRGNGSTGRELRWYADRSDPSLPTAWMLSVPLMVYRLAMLAWALWLARALLGWLRWGWSCFSADGLWRPLRPSPETAPASDG